MRRPQDVRIWKVQDRSHRGVPRPWIVRWAVDGREASRSFAIEGEADAFRARLRIAAADSKPFDPRTKLPSEWSERSEQTVAQWAFTWMSEQWETLTPRSRKSIVEALDRVLPVLVLPGAPEPPADLRREIRVALSNAGGYVVPRWLQRHSIPLADLDRQICAQAHRALGRKLDGASGSTSTAQRYRKSTRHMLDAAVERGLLASNPWPKPSRGATQRKAAKSAKSQAAVDVKRLPSVEEARRLIQGMATHKPTSADYVVTGWLVYLAGMRPSEARALEVTDLKLPASGWGSAWVHQAEQSAGQQWTDKGEEIGLTKTAVAREVPLCPELVRVLRSHLGERTDGPVVAPSTYSNFSRAWRRSRDQLGESWTPYDLRHLHASLALSGGAPLTEVARRLGHSVETLVRVYAHAMPQDAALVNDLLEGLL
jgi:integrase